jgi:hypothetical protein
MGNAMLILSVGALFIFGMVQLNLSDNKVQLVADTAEYASENHAMNVAFTTIQLAMEKINEDPDWQPTQANPWVSTRDGANTSLYYTTVGVGAGVNDPDTIKVVSKAEYLKEEAEVISLFAKTKLHFVPDFEAALSIATDRFTFGLGGSATIRGNDKSGTCSDKPAITVPNSLSESKVLLGAGSKITSILGGASSIEVNSDISYSPVDELIARLAAMPGSKKISGNYKGSLGSIDDPGVFFVENYAKLTGGIDTGYGIMIIRSGGELAYEGELSVAGNFEFNGLIIFENAFDFTGRGTPDLNGSVLVGTTDASSAILDIDLSGNLKIQYDCSAEEYAQAAAANLLKQNRFKRLNTYE